jgi:FlaG/FlaF family flagellin (archaellin)
VIGLVLLIAITLLLASTVGWVAVTIGDQNQRQSTPTTAFDFEYQAVPGEGDTLRIVHTSGKSLQRSELDIVVEAATCTGGDPNGRFEATAFGGTGTLSAGESLTLDGSVTCSGELDLSTATVRILWLPDADSESGLQTWTGPK